MLATSRVRHFAVLPFVLAVVLIGSLFTLVPQADAVTRSYRVGNAFDIARHQLGDPYRWGAAGPDAFDCSGLVYYSFRRAGFTNVPRTAAAQAGFARHIARSNMRRGDLVFFSSGGHVYHVGVFAGWSNGRRMIVHASRTGTPVKRDPIWTNAWFPGTLR
ncbi:C40 family peptidase [Nocardioides mesophilus]|uniref:C40 family peptidase n=1 Tax=Nocardioides mesophilus TaxID=433659 RepID=A0A7G9REP6_9ACTN|nr:C40 family peptidase [Nocardioides mesophilus]QNN54071.1 C40 family peptidase [Nocardioides mesophilus]